jgi:hypothetical protein
MVFTNGLAKERRSKMRKAYGKALEDVVEQHWCNGDTIKMSMPSDDKERGVDVYYYGLPIDVTLLIGKKDHCHRIGQYACTIAGKEIFKVSLGVRFANNHHDFDEPVLVIGFDTWSFNEAKYQVETLSCEDIDSMIDMYYNHLDMLDGNLKEEM